MIKLELGAGGLAGVCESPETKKHLMTASDLIRRLHTHRQWVNHRLREAVRPLNPEQLRRPLAIGQGSVWKTLTHLLAAEYVWLEALLGNPSPTMPGDLPGRLPGNQEGEGALQTLEELATAWQELDARWNQYLGGLTDDALEEIVHKTSTSSQPGQRHGVKRSDILLHVCTHAQYTTAQLTNMLRQLGVTPLPDVMLITLARQEANR
ncbi:MAG: DinB family protein [Pirellulaceae bacterium]